MRHRPDACPHPIPGGPRRSPGVGTKLVALLAAALILLFGGVSTFVFSALDTLADRQDSRAHLLETLNNDLRAEVFAMQDRYLAVPERLKVDPHGALEAWLASLAGATRQRHVGREALVARYRDRGQRRDLQKPGRYVVEAAGDGASLSYGQFDAAGVFAGDVLEWHLPGMPPAQVEARVAAAERQAEDPAALAGKVSELAASLVDEALAAEDTRNALLDQVERIGRANAALAQTDRRLRRELLAATTGGLLGALLLLFAISRQIVTRPLGRIAAAARAISAEAAVDLAEARRGDQIGDVARAVEEFQQALAGNRALQEEQARERAAMLAAVQRRLAEVARRLDRQVQEGVEDARQISDDLAADAEALRTRSAHGQQSAGVAVGSAQRGAETTAQGRAQALDLRNLCLGLGEDLDRQRRLSAEVSAEARQATLLVDSLTATAAQIGDVLTLVDRIAGKINLLALNAMIEASQAGQAGAGFAIVAAEVKDLSLQTSDASRSIAGQIEAIHQATGAATGTVSRIESRVGDVDRSIAGIVQRFAAVVSTTADLADGASATARLNQELVSINETVRDDARQTDELSHRMSRRAAEIGAAVHRLRDGLAAVLRAAEEPGVDGAAQGAG